jgi:hypothetical protein
MLLSGLVTCPVSRALFGVMFEAAMITVGWFWARAESGEKNTTSNAAPAAIFFKNCFVDRSVILL